MKTIRLFALFIITAFSSQAYANLVLSPDVCDNGDAFCAKSDDNSGPNDAAKISELFGVTVTDLLYKANVGGGEDGSYADYYETVFANTSTDPEDGTVSFSGGNSLDCETNACFLEVKDGNQNPARYLFDITGWDGTMDIIAENFWPSNGAISYIAIWGGAPICTQGENCPDPRNEVPEPSSLMILALSLVGLVSRKKLLS